MTENQIRNIVSSLGFELRLPPKKVKRYVNLPKILEFSPESCYMLGFLWGDGFLGSSYQIGVNNIYHDVANILWIFNTFGNWQIKERHRENRQKQLSLHINDEVFYRFLESVGYRVKKSESASLIINEIPERMRKYWWRGFFDADGHITFEENRTGGVNKISFSLSSSYDQDWSFVHVLFEKLNITKYQTYKHIHENNKGKFCQIRMSSFNEILKFLEYIYDGDNHIGLGRKYFKYLLMKENLDYRKISPHYKYGLIKG